jgi:hypothetical protein
MFSTRTVVRLLVQAFLAALIFISLTGGVAYARSLFSLRPSFSCSTACDGHFPNQNGCLADARIVTGGARTNIFTSSNNSDTGFVLMWSQTCGTNWTRALVGSNGLAISTIQTWRKNSGGSMSVMPDNVTGFVNGIFDGRMLFAPSNPARACAFPIDSTIDQVCTDYF